MEEEGKRLLEEKFGSSYVQTDATQPKSGLVGSIRSVFGMWSIMINDKLYI